MKKFTLLLLLPFFMFSCADDEETPTTPTDIRDAMVGSYSTTIKYYNTSGGLEDSETTTFEVKKHSTNATSFNIFEGNELFAKCVKIIEASNGIGFDVETAVEVEYGVTYQYVGIDFFELGSTKYNGLFEKSTNDMGFAVQVFEDGTYVEYWVFVMSKL